MASYYQKHLSVCTLSLAFLILIGCKSKELSTSKVKGKYLGNYCEGVVIEILDGAAPVRDWKHMFSDQTFHHSVVASLDSVTLKGVSDPLNLKGDSTFLFTFREGGYARKLFNICEPAAFITISETFKND